MLSLLHTEYCVFLFERLFGEWCKWKQSPNFLTTSYGTYSLVKMYRSLMLHNVVHTVTTELQKFHINFIIIFIFISKYVSLLLLLIQQKLITIIIQWAVKFEVILAFVLHVYLKIVVLKRYNKL